MIGLVMAVVAALLSIMMQNLFSAGKGSVASEMIVTARNLPAGTQLVAEDLKTMPAKGNVKNAISSRSALVGRILVVPMQTGQMFREEDLIQQGSGAMIASQLPAGYRAITVVLNDTSPGVVLYPGALVDLLATMEMPAVANTPKETITRTVLERIRVLAVNDEAVGIKPNETTANERRINQRRLSVTLAVTPEQAAQVELAGVRGTIGITLRSDADKLTDPTNYAVATWRWLSRAGNSKCERHETVKRCRAANLFIPACKAGKAVGIQTVPHLQCRASN